METSSVKRRVYSIILLVIFTLPKVCLSQNTKVVPLPCSVLFRYSHDIRLEGYAEAQCLDYREDVLPWQYPNRQYIYDKTTRKNPLPDQEKRMKCLEAQINTGTIAVVLGAASLTILVVSKIVKINNYLNNLKMQTSSNANEIKTLKKYIVLLKREINSSDSKIASLEQEINRTNQNTKTEKREPSELRSIPNYSKASKSFKPPVNGHIKQVRQKSGVWLKAIRGLIARCRLLLG